MARNDRLAIGSVWADRALIGAMFDRARGRLRWEYGVLAAGGAVAALTASLSGGGVAHSTSQQVLVANAVAGFTVAGVCWLRRRPASTFGFWLLAFAACTAVVSLENSANPHFYGTAAFGRAPFMVVGLYCFLSFPTGYLHSRATRLLMGVGGGALALSALPTILSASSTDVPSLGGCRASCPSVRLYGVPDAMRSLLNAIHLIAPPVVAVAVCVVLVHRFVAGSRPERRGLRWMVAVATVDAALYATRWLVTVTLGYSPEDVEWLLWASAVVWAVLPWAFVAPLVQSQMFARSALHELLGDLAVRPEPSAWERDMGRALDDPGLRLAFWSPSSQAYLGVTGDVIEGSHTDQGWYMIDRDGEPVAAILHDRALDGDPELLRAAGDATLLSIDGRHLEDEIRAARASAIATAEEERRRLERDLHDGAQQHLIALRIKLGLINELGGQDTTKMIAELGDDVEATLDELRRLAQGVYPPLLRVDGLGSALNAVARRSPIPVTVHTPGVGRFANDIESAVYFCCLEALQNAAKHAGRDANVIVRVSAGDAWLRFTVDDSGAGFDARRSGHGVGLANMEERMAAVGGSIRVVSVPGGGTTVSGLIPLARPPAAV
ncbi:MAG: sensor histidine kinase [Gaiellales bacterium]